MRPHAGRAARANAWLRARARGEENAVNRALERHHAMRGFRTPTIERSRLEAIEGVDGMCELCFIVHARARRAGDVARDARRRARERRGSYRQRNRRQPTAIGLG